MAEDELRNARVLVTGASGFIGGALCRRLAALGAEVHGVSRRPREDATLRWHLGDFAQRATAGALLRTVAPDLLVHLASEVTGSREGAQVVPLFEANLAAAVYLMDAIAASPVRRLVLAGSMEEPVGEEVAASPYAVAKAAATAYARFYHAAYGLPVATARLFMVYGPGQADPHKLVPYVIRALLTGEAARLSSGRRPVDWVYVDDVVDGLLAMLTAPGAVGERIDLGSGELVTVAEVVRRLHALIPEGPAPALGALADRPREVVRRADRRPAERLLGWRPERSLDEGLALTVAAARAAAARRPEGGA